MDWSYSLLNGPEQSVLRRLSVFVEGFDLDAAEAVCGFGDIEAFDVTDLLGSLVDKSLVVAEPTGGALRYHLLETIRQFSAEHLVEMDEREAVTVGSTHCAHFLAVAERTAPLLTGPDQAQWLEALHTDQANFRRAIQHAASRDDGGSEVLRFAVSLQRYLWARARSEEGLELLAPVLELPDSHPEPALLVRALVTIIFIARYVDAALAQRLAERALRIARPLDDPPLLVEALAWLCCACYFTGDYEEGFPLGAEAVALARTLGDDVLLGQSLLLYLLCSHRLEPAHSDALITEALAATQRSGDQFVSMILRNNAGVYALEAGDMAAARAHLEEARRATPAYATTRSNILVNLGWVEREEGNSGDSTTSFQDALRTSRRNGDHAGSAYASLGLACLAGDRGDWPQGATLHGVSRALFDRTGEKCQEPEDSYRRRSMAEARAQLGEEEFERLYAEGRRVGFDQAVDLALGRVRH